MNEKILSIKNLVVKFYLRSKVLTALRDITFDIYRNETIAIVGESGSGKSLLTKSLTNMLDSNGYIANGSITYYPKSDNKSKTCFERPVDLVKFNNVTLNAKLKKKIKKNNRKIISKNLKQINQLNKSELQQNQEQIKKEINNLNEEIKWAKQEISNIKQVSLFTKAKYLKILKILKIENKDQLINHIKIDSIWNWLNNIKYRNDFEQIAFEVFSLLKEKQVEQDKINELIWLSKHYTNFNFLIKRKTNKRLQELRGSVIATIFQDPTSSLNPLLSVGYQISEALMLHSNLTYAKAKIEAIKLMQKVGITDAENRYHHLQNKYSGGMRQRIVIAIALACKPKILICDEPTTALDVTIQAQILDLIRELKEEYKFTVIFITHDLSVVANIANRVAVMYAGQIIEYGKTEEIFYDPKHPYTWSLLLALPFFGEKGKELFAIKGSPPSLFENIKGDAFAKRNPFALEIDYLYDPPLFKVSDTHYAKTWLLDKRALKIEKPEQLKQLQDMMQDQEV